MNKEEIIRLRAKNYGISYTESKQQIEAMERKARNQEQLIAIGKWLIKAYRKLKSWFL